MSLSLVFTTGRRVMKSNLLIVAKIILISAFLTPVYAITTPILDYRQLVTALEQGDEVRAVIHIDKCILNTDTESEKIPNLTGTSTRLNFNNYTHHKLHIGEDLKDTIATSITMLIETPHGEFWNHYGRLRVFEDNSANFYIAYYDPITNQKKLSMDWTCQLGNGKNGNAIILFDVKF